MISRHDRMFNEKSIFNKQEDWRFDEGKMEAQKVDLLQPCDPRKSDKYQEGWEEGRNAKKRQMMEDLIMGKIDEKDVDDYKTQLGLP